MRTVGSILVFLVFVIALVMIFGVALGRRSANRVRRLLKGLDDKYEAFIEKKVALHVVNKDAIDNLEELVEDTLMVIRPDIEGLASLLRNDEYVGVHVRYNSRYFNNVGSLLESCFNKAGDKRDGRADEVKQLHASVRSAILADLEMRELDLKMGRE